MSPVSILNVVVFPAPLIPSKPKHWVETTQRPPLGHSVSHIQASLENKQDAVVMDDISNFLYVDTVSLKKSSPLTPLMNCIYRLDKYSKYMIETRTYSVRDCFIVYQNNRLIFLRTNKQQTVNQHCRHTGTNTVRSQPFPTAFRSASVNCYNKHYPLVFFSP